jgi:polysaccharide export outer membrane protein
MMKNRWYSIAWMAAISLILVAGSGCQSTGASRMDTPEAEIDDGQPLAGVEALPKDLGSKTKKDRRVAYTVGPDDVLNVDVRQHPDVGGSFTVSPEGTIFISMIGSVEVEDATTDEIASRIETRLGEFIRDPEVAVSVKEYNSKKIYVLGQVDKPGEFTMQGNTLSVRDAVLLAGLPMYTANIHRVAVITPDEEDPQVVLVNLDDILYRGIMRQNLELKPGDIVVVHRHLLAKVGALLDQIVGPTSRIQSLERTVDVLSGNRRY